MGTPVRTTNRRGEKVTRPPGLKLTRKLTVRHTVDKPVIDIANLLAKAIAGFIDAYAADKRSETSLKQTGFANEIAMRKRVFELVAPKIKTIGGMAPLGKQYVEVEGEGP